MTIAQTDRIRSKLITACLLVLMFSSCTSSVDADDSTGGTTEDPNDLLKIALGKVSKKCQDAVSFCSSLSEEAKAAIQAKMYCEIMNSTIAVKCLQQSGCAAPEVDTMKQTVCAQTETTTPVTVETDALNIALGQVSKKCQDAVSFCSSLSEEAKAAIQAKMYCEIMNNTTAVKCLQQSGCAAPEVDTMKQTVCAQTETTTPLTVETDALKIALGKVSKKCQDAVSFCSNFSEEAKAAIQAKMYCEIMNNTLAVKCLQQSGCAAPEVDTMKQTVCSGAVVMTTPKPSKSPQTKVTDSTDRLVIALNKVTQRCDDGLWKCVDLSPDAKALVSEKKYCTVMTTPQAPDCLKAMQCTDKEVAVIKETVCAVKGRQTTPSTPRPELWVIRQLNVMGPNALSSALSTRLRRCQDSFWACYKAMPETRHFLNLHHYCQAMRDRAAMMCMVGMGHCTERDMDFLKEATCKGVPEEEDNNGESHLVPDRLFRLALGLWVAALVFKYLGCVV